MLVIHEINGFRCLTSSSVLKYIDTYYEITLVSCVVNLLYNLLLKSDFCNKCLKENGIDTKVSTSNKSTSHEYRKLL